MVQCIIVYKVVRLCIHFGGVTSEVRKCGRHWPALAMLNAHRIANFVSCGPLKR